jgi:hypothetical protein
VDLGITLALLTGVGGILVGATALVPALVTGFDGVDLLVALVCLGIPCGGGLVAGALRLRARRGRGLLFASAGALALVGSAAALLLASEMSQIMNGVEGSFGELAPGHLLLVLPPPLATVIAVSMPAVATWLRSAAPAEARPGTASEASA